MTTKNPKGPNTGSSRVFRGGSWGSYTHQLCSAFRDRGEPGDRYSGVGFRVVRTHTFKTLLSDPKGPKDGSYRVFRGGSWSGDAQYLRSACRFNARPGPRFGNVGFRLVRTLSLSPITLDRLKLAKNHINEAIKLLEDKWNS
jgi:formylglycine-generating enzyme required for sulfatase activity